MIKGYSKENVKLFITGYIYHLARLITLYLAAIYFTLNPLMQEAEE